MNIPLIEQAEKNIEESEARLAEIQRAEFAAVRAENGAKERIANLQAQLPSLLATRALGVDNGGEIAQIKKEISLAEEIIQDTPLVREGLRALKPPETHKLRNAKRILEKLDKYLSIKEQLKEGYSPTLAGSLRDYAKVLGLESDGEEFLNKIPQHRS